MLGKLLLIASSVLVIASCGNKCKEEEETARNKHKDTSLMYLWRFTDNLIKTGATEIDSGFISFKPNGDYNHSPNRKYIYTRAWTWYSNNDIIRKNYCLDKVPQDDPVAKYLIRNDTLILYPSTGGGNSFATVPETYVHYKKY